MAQISVNYRDFLITYNEDAERWSASDIESNWSSERQTLKEVKKKIDEFLKKQIENTECLYIAEGGYRTDFGTKITVTSIDAQGDVWAKKEKGNREKFSKESAAKYLALNNEYNLAVIEEYKEQLKNIEIEKRKARGILDKLQMLRLSTEIAEKTN